MPTINPLERATQNRVIDLFVHQLGYTNLGNWEEREDNANVEEEYLRKFLAKQKLRGDIVARAVNRLQLAAKEHGKRLYDANKAFYSILRYGVKVKVDASENTETVHLIDWQNPENNDFYVAEEVTVHGNREKRPDLVLYVNGIATVVIELKRSSTSIGDGIRQSITNQLPEFIGSFFNTVQIILAGNDSEGLRYGTIGTEEKFFLQWKEDIDDTSIFPLDRYLIRLCGKKRLLELIYDFIIFEGDKKKLPRHHQYFGIKAAQDFVRRRESGIIWHTQGSGKSIVMVLLAKWILEKLPNARVAIITDRDELDKQIRDVFTDSGEDITRASSGRDLMARLVEPKPRLLCSLIHKFGRNQDENIEKFIEGLKKSPLNPYGEIFVFVDECHRTQGGKLHRIMKAILQDAVFIGFTGTPRLTADQKTTLEVFGRYIHTYKFNEAVKDEVVLDLIYEARDIDQILSSQERVDQWFDAKTRGLNDFQRSALKKKWGTMQNVLSSRPRMEKIVDDILLDFFSKVPRLMSGRGNALLVAKSIYEACRYYELFSRTELNTKVALITSYNPNLRDITTEDIGAHTETEKQYIYNIYQSMLGNETTTQYEERRKKWFKNEPARVRLMIVVDKLLTGFDAPSCSYIYIDKSMQDHALFQAICRVNRLDSEDKKYGYIVDYQDLFKKVENTIGVYTSELDYDNFKAEDCQIELKTRIEVGLAELRSALEQVEDVCLPVESPREHLQYQQYFCGNTEIPEDLARTEPKRVAMYKSVAALVRAYANIASDLPDSGLSHDECEFFKMRTQQYAGLRDAIRMASGEYLDTKPYEADMRYLLDTYIEARPSEKVSRFDNLPLVEIIVTSGLQQAVENLPQSIQNNHEAVAETIENNIRQKLIQQQLVDPAYYEKMSILLVELIRLRRQKALDYQEYLAKIAELVQNLAEHGQDTGFPRSLDTVAKRALYNNLGQDEEKAFKIYQAVMSSRQDSWRGNEPKERLIKQSLYQILGDENAVEQVFAIILQQKEF